MAVTITTHRGGFAGVYVPACQLQEEALDEGQESACGAQRIIARLAGCRRGEGGRDGGRESIGAGGQAGRHLRISRGSVDHGEPGHHLDAPGVVGSRFGRGGDGCSGDHAPKYFAHSRFGVARVGECGELIDQPPSSIGPEIPPDFAGLSAAMRNAFIAFAATGDPGWPRFDTTERIRRIWTNPPGLGSDTLSTSRRIWQREPRPRSAELGRRPHTE
nr:hypothetical protein [Nocardia nova]